MCIRDRNSSIFNMIRSLSENVMVPIAGIILTFVMCLDLFSFGAGQLTPGFGLRLCRFGLPLCLCREQCHTPPCRDLPARCV